MAKRLIGILIISAASVWALTGCDNNVDTIDSTSKEVTEQTTTTTPESSKDGISATKDSALANTIDWSAIASDETAATLANYDYPFALDSQSVHAYADYFKIDNVSAQHNLTVGMASNEALSKALDAVGTSYVSHELTDGDKVELIIHTTPDISASRYDYILADDFAKGLILPIVIKPDGKKGDVEEHGGS
ncbi:hypothetical protein [Psychrobacter urativorans]|uniref:hypothetical protein n=1 Tax=Psychrobacter urativorans TaxID=45610 RepID=UPI001918D397|nr:hypothetical protein [Psychrobacter urativorans]